MSAWRDGRRRGRIGGLLIGTFWLCFLFLFSRVSRRKGSIDVGGRWWSLDDEVEGDDKFLVATRVDWSVTMEKAKLSSVWEVSRDCAGGTLRYTSARGKM